MTIRHVMRTLLTLMLSAALSLLAVPLVVGAENAPRAVVIDTDMAVDDWMAIVYLLQRRDISIKGITVSAAGEVRCNPGVQHALGLVALVGKNDIPVACGREKPLRGEHTFPEAWRQDAENLLGLTLPKSPYAAADQTAAEFLTALLQRSSQKVTLLTLGPLTTIAEAIQTTPTLVAKLDMIYIMGGAIEVAGNIASAGVGIANPTAEWNLYIDPRAANIVFRSGVPITLVPLDATNQVPVTVAFYETLKKAQRTPAATFVFEVLTKLDERGALAAGWYYFWDPLAAAILSEESLATFKPYRLIVIEQEGAESGRTTLNDDGASVRVVVAVDRARFEQVFLNVLNGK